MRQSLRRWWDAVAERFVMTGSTLDDSLVLLPRLPMAYEVPGPIGPNLAVGLPEVEAVFGAGPSTAHREGPRPGGAPDSREGVRL